MKDLSITTMQSVCLVFYAIFWGAIFNVLPRYKAFNWPLVFTGGTYRRKARRRTALAFLMFNIAPLVFFGYVMWALKDVAALCLSHLIVRGVVPAFAIIGIYRIWLGIVESCPDVFYAAKHDDVPRSYRHVEPIYRTSGGPISDGLPVVDVATGAGKWNLGVGIGYVTIAAAAPWWTIWPAC